VRGQLQSVKVGESTVDGPAARVKRPAPTEIVDSQKSIVNTDSVEESTQIFNFMYKLQVSFISCTCLLFSNLILEYHYLSLHHLNVKYVKIWITHVHVIISASTVYDADGVNKLM
jgi:hypothetical protein